MGEESPPIGTTGGLFMSALARLTILLLLHRPTHRGGPRLHLLDPALGVQLLPGYGTQHAPDSAPTREPEGNIEEGGDRTMRRSEAPAVRPASAVGAHDLRQAVRAGGQDGEFVNTTTSLVHIKQLGDNALRSLEQFCGAASRAVNEPLYRPGQNYVDRVATMPCTAPLPTQPVQSEPSSAPEAFTRVGGAKLGCAFNVLISPADTNKERSAPPRVPPPSPTKKESEDLRQKVISQGIRTAGMGYYDIGGSVAAQQLHDRRMKIGQGCREILPLQLREAEDILEAKLDQRVEKARGGHDGGRQRTQTQQRAEGRVESLRAAINVFDSGVAGMELQHRLNEIINRNYLEPDDVGLIYFASHADGGGFADIMVMYPPHAETISATLHTIRGIQEDARRDTLSTVSLISSIADRLRPLIESLGTAVANQQPPMAESLRALGARDHQEGLEAAVGLQVHALGLRDPSEARATENFLLENLGNDLLGVNDSLSVDSNNSLRFTTGDPRGNFDEQFDSLIHNVFQDNDIQSSMNHGPNTSLVSPATQAAREGVLRAWNSNVPQVRAANGHMRERVPWGGMSGGRELDGQGLNSHCDSAPHSIHGIHVASTIDRDRCLQSLQRLGAGNVCALRATASASRPMAASATGPSARGEPWQVDGDCPRPSREHAHHVACTMVSEQPDANTCEGTCRAPDIALHQNHGELEEDNGFRDMNPHPPALPRITRGVLRVAWAKLLGRPPPPGGG